MKDSAAENHRVEIGINQTFEQAAMEVLNWEREEFQGADYEASKALGKEEVESTFSPEGRESYDAEKLSRVIRFLASKMRSEDVSRLQAMLDQQKGVRSISAPPKDADLDPSEALRAILSGTHNKRIEVSKIASRGDVYTMALYLYMNTTGHSEEEMTGVLSDLVATYDDPESSHYDVGIDGLSADPFLAILCRKAIEQYGLQEGVRSQVRQTLEHSSNEMQQAIGRGNAWSMRINLKKSA